MKPIVDYLIVIPLDEEFGYVRRVIERLIPRKLISKTIGPELYALTILPTASGQASAVLLSVGRMTEAPVQSAVEAAVRTWRPAAIVMVGIAGSLEPDRLKLGDVIVPSKVFGYSEGKAEVVDGKLRMKYRTTGHRLDCDLTALARAIDINWEADWRSASRKAGRADTMLRPKLLARSGKDGPNLHITDKDSVGSGNVVVASREFAAEVRAALDDTVRAVEMEAKGLCEALGKVKPAPSALVVRGISDYADEDKAALEADTKDGWRRYAAQNAARFVLALIRSRPETAEGYRPVATPAYPMLLHPDTTGICLRAMIRARETGMVALAFNPFVVCADGLPATALTFEARHADGTAAQFTDFLLHQPDDKLVLATAQDTPRVSCRLERSGEPPALELLVGLPAADIRIELTAADEFGRTTRAAWPQPGTPEPCPA